MRVGVKGRLEFFRKFIRFGSGTLLLQIHTIKAITLIHHGLAHHYAILLCSLDVEIDYLTRPKQSGWATN